MGWFSLITVLLKIVHHFLQNKTPEAKKTYVENLQSMSEALVDGSVDDINSLFMELRESAREGDPDGLGVDKKPGRDVHGDSGVA